MKAQELNYDPCGCCLTHGTATVPIGRDSILEVRRELIEDQDVFVLMLKRRDGRLIVGDERIPSGVTMGIDEGTADQILAQLVGAP